MPNAWRVPSDSCWGELRLADAHRLHRIQRRFGCGAWGWMLTNSAIDHSPPRPSEKRLHQVPQQQVRLKRRVIQPALKIGCGRRPTESLEGLGCQGLINFIIKLHIRIAHMHLHSTQPLEPLALPTSQYSCHNLGAQAFRVPVTAHKAARFQQMRPWTRALSTSASPPGLTAPGESKSYLITRSLC